MELTAEAVDRVVRAALAEDVGAGDLTTEASCRAEARCRAAARARGAGRGLRARGRGRGLRGARPGDRVEPMLADGSRLDAGDVPARVATVEGPARAVLTGERTALNLLGRLSGDRDADRALRRARRGHRRDDPGHAQDDARAAGAREVRGPLRRRRRTTAPGSTTRSSIKENHLRLAGGITAAAGGARRSQRHPGRGRGGDARGGRRGARAPAPTGSCSTT